ncbi:MAG: DUF401 family protein [Phascolarctobacterium sp.]|nr:DUF401 family protein [Phascolarctobacterium sp.]
MNIFVVLTIALAVIVILLRIKFPIGPAMLVAGLLIWLLKAPEPVFLWQALTETLSMHRTYDIILALYFVMCLEIELRTSGTLAGMVSALEKIFSGAKFTLAAMPAFLGLLPSLGGARFSAPIVEEAAKDLNLSAEHKSAINFWFRHIFEFSNPIIPGMIIACSIINVPFSVFLKNLAWLTVVAFVVGYLILIVPIKTDNVKKIDTDGKKHYGDILLGVAPVLLNFLLVVAFRLNASLSMLLVTILMFFGLWMLGRKVNGKEVILDAIDLKMFMNVLFILYFIQILTVTKVLPEIVAAFQASPLPVPVIIACVSFIIGVLTGLSQGHVAIVMPIVAAMGTGDMTLASIAMAFGVAGQMLTPTHMCLIVTISYFKANLFTTLRPCFFCEVILLTIFSVVTYFIY